MSNHSLAIKGFGLHWTGLNIGWSAGTVSGFWFGSVERALFGFASVPLPQDRYATAFIGHHGLAYATFKLTHESFKRLWKNFYAY
jgi:hypothetical protein